MANLDLTADKAVRDAVDAFVEGRLVPDFAGETVFETKNSRYRLLDGIVFAAPDDSLVGSELVGWLMESRRRSVVESAWQPGSRAVLVDRHRGRNIIVTSTTRLLHLEEVSVAMGGGQGPPQTPLVLPRAAPAAEVPVPLSAHRVPIVSATPPPSAAAVQKRAAAIHLPPRPAAPARPLPLPAAPPRRAEPSLPQVNSQTPAAGTAWELTSSEFEVDVEATRPDHAVYDPSRHDALQYDEEELASDTPIPLVRHVEPPLAPPRPTIGGPRR